MKRLSRLLKPVRTSPLPFVALALAATPALAQEAGANEDESKVPAYTLPDPLRLLEGGAVTNAADWRERRRPEILRLFEEHVYGRSPAPPKAMRFVVLESDAAAFSGRATRRQVRVLLDGRDPGPALEILLYVPNAAPRPAPAFLALNFDGNHAINPDPGIRLSTSWVGEGSGVVDHRATTATRGSDSSSWPVERILDRGYALATVSYGDIEPDHPQGWKSGVRSSFGPGASGRLGPEDWGAIGAWAWGLSRALDYLETDRDVDARRVAVLGHSRLGKTALWAGARDERFAMVVSNDSGEGGAALSRRRFGETVAAITSRFPHWFAPRFAEYANHEDALPVDQHMLLALVAPRPLYVASATDDLWADPRGEFLSAKAAEPVYRLLGRDRVGIDAPPAPDRPVGGTIGYHRRSGPHGLTAYDWEQYLDFADRHLGTPPGR
jgi:(4-O-methyl)-D-glucuronate---lignin esterase